MAEHLMSPATGNQGYGSLFTVDSGSVHSLTLHSCRHVAPDVSNRAPEVSNSAAVGAMTLMEQQRLDGVSQRLIRLAYTFYEDFQCPMSQVSIQAALAFFQHHVGANIPAFSADASGHVIATWRNGREVLTMRFAQGGVIQYALVAETEGAALQRSWGVTDLGKASAEDFAGSAFLFG